MSNSKFQQAREGVLAFMDEITVGWSEAEKREMANTINGIFFTGQVKEHPLIDARLSGVPRAGGRRAGRA